MTKSSEFSSFRDPSGFVFYKSGNVYRKINNCYVSTYDYLISSGLFEELSKNGMIIPHEEVNRNKEGIELKVDKVKFISYPYEWCFEQLKDAALLTLEIEKKSLNYGMTLKDASAYNVQFYNGKAVFIDTLSFDMYEEGQPWGAYGQFCRHFMAPLLLMGYVNENLNCLLKNYIDGIPLDLASDILKNRGGFAAFEHIKLHSNSISKNNKTVSATPKISKKSLLNMIDMIMRQIAKIKPKHNLTEWENYYDNTNYSVDADADKNNLLKKYLDEVKFNDDDIIVDLGANDGKFSKTASEYCNTIISFDIDYNAVSNNYIQCKKNEETKILPLILDVNNPSPAIGFDLLERSNFKDRCNAKCTLALALIHHICISNNIPYDKLRDMLYDMSEFLIIEYVPKNDSKVEELLLTRKDIFDWYTEENFEDVFLEKFSIVRKNKIENSKRVLYLMEKKNGK